MEYIIYTYGGGDLLISVFNAVAMIFETDNKYLTPVGTMALTLGGIYAGIKATFKADIAILGKNWMIPSMIAFFLLFSPKTTVWIKDEVALNAPVKIDNIPFGISFFTSVGTKISHGLSKLIEETMLPVNAGRSTTGGILYGAKAVAKIRDIQIQDPILLRNTKEYLRQCYMLPYVIGNFGGKKIEAQKAVDLLAYLDTNPVKRLGIKATNKDGSVGSFMTCTEAGKMLKGEIATESKAPALMKQFAAVLGISTTNEVLMNKRIKAMTGDVFKYLEQGTEDVNAWMQQAMILNANRESYDDWREKVGHPRVYPDLIRMQATRGLFQQSMGSIIGGEMSEAMIPAAAQPTMLALVVMLFVIILPFAMLPGGWVFINTGIKLMIWVCTWPVFYTIIHAIAMIQLKDSIGGWGLSGLSAIGQAGFTELIMMKYATVQSLISATPLISFAIVFGSPYALSSIAGGLANTNTAMPIGGAMADGNLQMKQTSYDNTTKGQHNVSPTLIMGSSVVDGANSVKMGQDGGNVILTEQGTQLINNHTGTEGQTATVGDSYNRAQSDLASLTDRHSKISNLTEAQSIDFAKSLVNGTVQSDNISDADIASMKQVIGDGKTLTQGTDITKGQSTGTQSNVTAGASFWGSGVSTGTNAANTEDIRKTLSEQDRQTFDNFMEKSKTIAKNQNFTTNNSQDQKLGESLGSNLTKQESIGKEIAKTTQDVETYGNQLSYLQHNSGAINSNLNDAFLNEVMARHPELASKAHAQRWVTNHPEEAKAIGQDVVRVNDPLKSPEYQAYVSRIQKNAPSVQNTEIPTEDSLKSKYEQNAQNIREQAVVKDATGAEKPLKEVVSNAVNNPNLKYNKPVEETLKNNLNPEQLKIAQNLENERVRGDDSKSKLITKKIKEGKEDFKSLTGKHTGLRVLRELGNNTGEIVGIERDDNKKSK
jgi:conjugal transfer mating pair stabilization protein TraG